MKCYAHVDKLNPSISHFLSLRCVFLLLDTYIHVINCSRDSLFIVRAMGRGHRHNQSMLEASSHAHPYWQTLLVNFQSAYTLISHCHSSLPL